MASPLPRDADHLSEARRQALVQAALDAIVSMDCAGTILEFNTAAERTFGYKQEEAIGRSLSELLIPASLRPAHRRGLAHYLATGEGPVLGRRVETTALRADGTEFPIELSITPIVAEGTTAFSAFIRDLTERRRAEEMRTRLVDILEATSDFVGTFDPAGGALWLNRAARRLRGLPEGETVPRLPLRSYHPEWACNVIFHQGIPTAKRQGIWSGETAMLTADGRQVPVSQVIVVHRSPSGTVEYFSTILRDISAQKQAESLLRAREAEQRRAAWLQGAILNALPAHIALLDQQGGIVAVNEAWQRVGAGDDFLGAGLGLRENYLEGCARRQGELAETAREAARGIQAVLHCEQEFYALEYASRAPAGDRWFWLVVSPLYAGQRAGAVVAHLDITRRRLAEQELRASEERFRQLAENIRDVFWVTDTRPARLRYVSPAYEAIWGRPRQQLLDDPQAWLAAVHPDDLQRVRAGYRPNPPAPFALEYRIRRPDGSIRWILDRGFPIQDESGAVYRFVGIAEDLTERRQAEDALRAGEERLRGLLTAIPDLIFRLDTGGRFLDCKAEPETELSGLPATVLGKHYRDVLPSAVSQELATAIRAARRTQAVQTFEYDLPGERPRSFEARVVATADDQVVIVARNITERKEVEQTLWLRDKQYRDLIETSHDLIWSVDAAGATQFINRSACRRMLGHEPNELLGRPFTDFILAERRPAAWAEFERVLAGQPVVDFETVCLRKDGSGVWVSVNSLAQTGEHGQVLGAVGIVRDVTEARHAQEALQERNEMLRAVIQSAPVAIVEFDLEGQVLLWNPAAERVFGWTEQEVLGRFYPVLPPGKGDEFRQLFQRVIQGESIADVERSRLRKDGSRVDITVSAAPTLGAHGVRTVMSVMADITERKRAEEALRQSEARHRFLADNIKDVISELSPDGRLRYISASCQALFGHAPAELLGRHVFEMIHPDDIPHVRQLAAAANEHPDGFLLTYRNRRQDGSYLWVETTGKRIRDPQTGIDREIICVTRDVTKRKEAEQRAAQLNEQLEARVLERTAALQAAEARYRGLVEELPAITYTASLTYPYPFTYISPQLEAIVGYTPAEWLADSALWVDHLHADDRQRVLQELAQSRATGLPFHCEYRLLPREGDVLWFRDQAKIIRDEQGRPALLQGIMLDVTEYERERIGRERLQALSRRLVEVQEAERRAIARELHDEIGQTLTGLKLALETAAHLPAGQLPAKLLQTQGLVNELMARVRALSLDLRPAMLDDLGLLPALLWFFERFASTTNVQVAFEHAQLERRFAPAIETAAYRIVQEALTNVARHARAPQAIVRVWAGADLLGVQVRDAGVGFDYQKAANDGRTGGLTGMRERCILLGGKLIVESSPASGTCVTAELPM